MRTIQTNLYTYSELSDKAKERARKDYIDNCVFADEVWADNVKDTLKQVGKALGFTIEEIEYSGFYAHGDGLCFTGEYSYEPEAAARVKSEVCVVDECLSHILKLLERAFSPSDETALRGTIKNGDTYHKNSSGMYFERRNRMAGSYTTEEEALVGTAARLLADWAFAIMEKEYEYQTSEAVIVEMSEINDWEYTEDGKIYQQTSGS